MSAYNKSEIMQKAWKYVKQLGMTISQALKEVWEQAKAKVKRNAPKVANTSWYKVPPITVSVSCPNQGSFVGTQRVTGVYQSTIAR